MLPIKVLHLVASCGLYGKEQVILALMREHQHTPIDALLGSIRLPGEGSKDIEQVAQAEGLAVQPYILKRGLDFKGARLLLRDVQQKNIQIIHIHDYKGSILLGLQKWLPHTPLLMRTLHGFTTTTSFSKIAVYEWLDRQSLRFHDTLVGVSDDMKTRLSFPLQIIKNGITPASSEALQGFDDVKSFCSTGVIWGSVARLSAEKNQLALVDALAIAIQAGMDAKLLLLGEGEERSALENHIREKGLVARVMMPGFVPQARQCLPLLHLYVQPSFREGTPISILESMEAGIPLCMTPVGAMASLIQQGAGWELPFDGVGIAQRLLDLWNQPSRRHNLVQQARHIFEQEYSSRVMAQAYQSVYEQLMRRRGR